MPRIRHEQARQNWQQLIAAFQGNDDFVNGGLTQAQLDFESFAQGTVESPVSGGLASESWRKNAIIPNNSHFPGEDSAPRLAKILMVARPFPLPTRH